jgi:hypothetical protein
MSWVELYDVNDGYVTRRIKDIHWKVRGLLRKLKKGPSGIVAWWKLNQRCKELNRRLLAEAERTRNAPKYPDPMPKDVQEFVEWAQAHGIIEIKK